MTTTLFILHGYHSEKLDRTATGPEFEHVSKVFSDAGFLVKPFDKPWRDNTVSDMADLFCEFYENNKGNHNIVLGNSLGGMVAFVTAPLIKPQQLVLASLSACFKENLETYDEDFLANRVAKFGDFQVANFKQLSAYALAREINDLGIPTTLCYGEKERDLYPYLVTHVESVAKQMPGSELKVLPSAEHSLRGTKYLEGIVGLVKSLKH
ncbi:MAG: alpha/beta hydrolase [Gammaproteobacteria bacterium]|nr:alpha/beta hydrolase [Gammaproteobacteria bacterium]